MEEIGCSTDLLGRPPHVIKLNEGAQGAGVILAERMSASRSVIETLRGLYANFLVQEFIAEAEGADIRCFVVGTKIVASMRRPVRTRYFVRAGPMSAVTTCVPPVSGTMPKSISGSANCASSAAMRRSQAAAISQPAPSA